MREEERFEMELSRETIKDALESDFWKWYSGKLQELMKTTLQSLAGGDLNVDSVGSYARLQGQYQALQKAVNLPADQVREISITLDRADGKF